MIYLAVVNGNKIIWGKWLIKIASEIKLDLPFRKEVEGFIAYSDEEKDKIEAELIKNKIEFITENILPDLETRKKAELMKHNNNLTPDKILAYLDETHELHNEIKNEQEFLQIKKELKKRIEKLELENINLISRVSALETKLKEKRII